MRLPPDSRKLINNDRVKSNKCKLMNYEKALKAI